MRLAIAILALQLACVRHIERTVTPEIATVDHKAAFLKVHMKNGDLFVLSDGKRTSSAGGSPAAVISSAPTGRWSAAADTTSRWPTSRCTRPTRS